MRLLDTYTGQFIDVNDPLEVEYAILSHTWDSQGEQSYQELTRIQARFRPGRRTQGRSARISIAPPLTDERTPLLYQSADTNDLEWGPASFSDTPEPPRQVSAFSHVRSRVSGLLLLVFASLDPVWFFRRIISIFIATSVFEDARTSLKVKAACAIARDYGHRYIWIDSCCIDKTSSSELSEAINSMYIWYRNASVCYAFLADVPPGSEEELRQPGSAFRNSRWFKRGWTLQELIAPRVVVFLSSDWAFLGTKASLVALINGITGVEQQILTGLAQLQDVSVAERMSWASMRSTTRPEDEAYSLMGIFDIRMPTLYGENRRAFLRLQEEILRRMPDQTMLVWGLEDGPIPSLTNLVERSSQIADFNQKANYRTSPPVLLADRPSQFRGSRGVKVLLHSAFLEHLALDEIELPTYTATPFGMPVPFPMLHFTTFLDPSDTESASDLRKSLSHLFLAILSCEWEGKLLAVICTIKRLHRSYNVMEAIKLRVPGARGAGIDRHRYVTIERSQARLYDKSVPFQTLYVPTQSTDFTKQVDIPSSFNPKLAPWSAAILRDLGYQVSELRDFADRYKFLFTKDESSFEITFDLPYQGTGGEIWIYNVDPEQANHRYTSIPITRPRRLVVEQIGDSHLMQLTGVRGDTTSLRITTLNAFNTLLLDVEILTAIGVSRLGDAGGDTRRSSCKFPMTSRERALFWELLIVSPSST